MKYSTYLFFGSPGSGKGTHGRILGTVPGFCHLACGDVFRSLDTHTPLGRAFAEILTKINLLEAGELPTRQTEDLPAGIKVC